MMENNPKPRSSPFEDFTLCFGITFALSVLSYESYIPENMMRIYLPVIFVLFALAWGWFSLSNGYKKNLEFLAWTSAFWFAFEVFAMLKIILPKVVTLNIAYLFSADVSDIITAYPALVFSGFFGSPMTLSRILLFGICSLLYIIGYAINRSGFMYKTLNKEENYYENN